jgi:cytochrome c
MRALIAAFACVAAFSVAANAQEAGDPKKGEQVFKKCKICHQIGEGAKNLVGPVLNGVVGRQPGTYDGYSYSKAMVDFGKGKTWTNDLLFTYLESPHKVVPGTKMAFVGLKSAEDRHNVIAYLDTFSKK